jgi:hypothetical protein
MRVRLKAEDSKVLNPERALMERNVSHAKAQRRTFETRQRFAPLRLCVKNILYTGRPERGLPNEVYGAHSHL